MGPSAPATRRRQIADTSSRNVRVVPICVSLEVEVHVVVQPPILLTKSISTVGVSSSFQVVVDQVAQVRLVLNSKAEVRGQSKEHQTKSKVQTFNSKPSSWAHVPHRLHDYEAGHD